MEERRPRSPENLLCVRCFHVYYLIKSILMTHQRGYHILICRDEKLEPPPPPKIKVTELKTSRWQNWNLNLGVFPLLATSLMADCTLALKLRGCWQCHSDRMGVCVPQCEGQGSGQSWGQSSVLSLWWATTSAGALTQPCKSLQLSSTFFCKEILKTLYKSISAK